MLKSDIKPETVNGFQDQFEAASLDPGWTLVGGATVSVGAIPRLGPTTAPVRRHELARPRDRHLNEHRGNRREDHGGEQDERIVMPPSRSSLRPVAPRTSRTARSS